MTQQGQNAGYAVVGGAPGTTVLSSAVMSTEPSPIGVMRTSYGGATGASTSAPGYAVVGSPASAGMGLTGAGTIPPAESAVVPHHHQRPHVLAHLFGLDGFGAGRRARLAQAESQHAAIPYGPQNQTVTELPASMVYGR
jgi:hypothetical protein